MKFPETRFLCLVINYVQSGELMEPNVEEEERWSDRRSEGRGLERGGGALETDRGQQRASPHERLVIPEKHKTGHLYT